ncbi:hypothetical protein EV426DRAFT_686449 [Tirmania nivea]|nr:hypothetical protein EV426DRAFT_686449 [Tirmania nivea]
MYVFEDFIDSSKFSDIYYKERRDYFISAFKQDKLGNATDLDIDLIEEGYSGHEMGDVVVDAQLYEGPSGRRDYSTFKKLYGVLPETVQLIPHRKALHVLNKHATVIASKYETGSVEFYKLFARFVELYVESDYDDYLVDGNPTDVTRAYWSFLLCYKDEVTRVDVSDETEDWNFLP